MLNEFYLTQTIQNLKVVEVFDYFDGPRFYSCVSKSGQLYLVFWADETDNSTSWLYVSISPKRYLSVKAGRIAIREAFLQSEEGYVFFITVDKSQALQIQVLYSPEIPLDYLPEPNDFLSVLPNDESVNVQTMRSFIEALKSAIPELKLSKEQQAELEADLQTITTQQTSPHPKKIVITECLRSIQTLLESLVDNVIAYRFLNRLAALL